jgi:tetratricopeptide (TPR) repeat protein
VFRRKAVVSAEDADQLVADADEQAIVEGATRPVLKVIEASVKASRARLAQVGGPADRRRLARALWRQSTILATCERYPEAVGAAEESVALSRRVLADSGSDDGIVGEFAQHVADLALVIVAAGDRPRADRLLVEALDAGRRGSGAAALRGRATAELIRFRLLLDDGLGAATAGSTVDDEGLVAAGESTVDLLRGVATEDDPTTLMDLAQALHLLSRAYTVAVRPVPAAAALRESFALYSCFDGPASRASAQTVIDELRRLSRAAPEVEFRLPTPGSWAATFRDRKPPDAARTPAGARTGDAGRSAEDAPLDLAARSLEEGVRLSRGGRLAAAEPLLKTAVDGYAVVARDSDDPLVLRAYATALWRYSLVLHAAGRVAQARLEGQQGAAVRRRLLGSLRPGSAEHTEVLAESATALADLGETAFATGRPYERIALLDEAIEWCGDHADPRVRRALGTALHNKTMAMFAAYLSEGSGEEQALVELEAVVARAVEIRDALKDPGEPLTTWELANSLLRRCDVAILRMDGGTALHSLLRAWRLMERLGTGADDLREQALRAAALLPSIAPEPVRHARESGIWPF